MVVSKSQQKAIAKYREKNPDQLGYTALRRGGVNFVTAWKDSKKGTKSHTYVTSDYAKDVIEGESRYTTDLKNIIMYASEALKNQGFKDSDIKKLI